VQWERLIGHSNFWLKVGAVFLPMSVAASIYFLLCWWLKIPFMQDILRLLPRFRRSV
jgi:hypothetical protein